MSSRLAIAVGPGRPPAAPTVLGLGGERDQVNGYPIQPAKVQRPPLRDETLARERLLDWLYVKVHHRVVFVTAEAGYGKTTLLADFSRRTRLRTLWYRLDAEDRSWIAFVSHLVAAGREHDPGFAPTTFGLLGEIGATGPSRDSVVETFIREFQALGDGGAAVILDDYHAVDESDEVRDVLQALLSRAAERVTFVFSSRRLPSIRVARLRALGEVAELTTDDLRFSGAETERLFRETYGRPLEPDVLDDLARRTDGWAASLQLVQAAIRDRSSSEIRSFVRSISGAEGDLYDYLAEEVVGDLPSELQEFLMRVSVLETVEPRVAGVASGLDGDQVMERIHTLEKLGLLGKRGDRIFHRFHPLVRGFLRQRLAREIGDAGVRELHERIAASAGDDWKLAAYHFAEAGAVRRLHVAMEGATLNIMGAGDYDLAASYLERFPPNSPIPAFEVVKSRIDFQAGDISAAMSRARAAHEAAPDSDHALANLMAFELMVGDVPSAIELARSLERRSTDRQLQGIATGTVAMLEASVDLDLRIALRRLDQLADRQRDSGHLHYRGISLLNASAAAREIGDAQGTLARASEAIDLLEASSSGSEISSARQNRGWALVHLGRTDEGFRELEAATQSTHALARAEALTDAALIHAFYGSLEEAASLLQEARPLLSTAPHLEQDWLIPAAHVAIRMGRLDLAANYVAQFVDNKPTSTPGRRLHREVARAHLALLSDDEMLPVERALALAARQNSELYASYLRLLRTARAEPIDWDRAVGNCLSRSPAHASMLAELIGDRLEVLAEETMTALVAEARRRPLRWRTPLRSRLDTSHQGLRVARLLDEVGTLEDVPALRSIAKTAKDYSHVGKTLARRLAPRVHVEDQGRVVVLVGSRAVAGSEIRRKVLTALCFLVSQPNFSATRDQVLEALWPDLDPMVAANSLNQTAYFLRRVFEPNYREEVSPDYLHHDSELLWLDRDLVASRSGQCWELIRAASATGAPDVVDQLSAAYRGRFALDFEYEEWAASYRDALHAGYLQVIEEAVRSDMASGHFDRGIRLARAALEVDPGAEQLELSLLRLYRLSGAHAAAAEQYAHYANVIRNELGLQAPPLEEL